MKKTILILAIITLISLFLISCGSGKGKLHVESFPDKSDVYIDGVKVGVTTLDISVDVGEHTVEVKKEGYKTWKKTIQIRRGKETDIIANLEKALGFIEVETNPEGAEVFVDGESRGFTPVKIDGLTIGKHKILIKKSGYKSIEREVEVKEEGVSISEMLEEGFGDVIITSKPKRAKVIFDGEEKGETPLSINDVPLGKHWVTLKKLGYEELTKAINVNMGINKYEFELVEINHTLVIYSEPEGAKVYLNDTLKGITPLEIRNLVPEKTYKLKLELEGYLPYITEIKMPKDGSIFLPTVKLMKLNP